MTQAQNHDGHYLDIVDSQGLGFFVWKNKEGKAVAHDKHIVGHVFQSGEVKIHARSCRAVKMERRGTAPRCRREGNVEYVYHGMTVMEIAQEHFCDMIDQSMTLEEAVGYMGQSVCGCVKKHIGME